MTYYLIDYENVNSVGLLGCNNLTKNDYIIIFFTKHAMKIDMSQIADHGEAKLDMIEVPAGKQSTDIHIGSYIGYLSGIYKANDCNIVVISKDTDFDNVIKFWMKKTKINILRKEQIKNTKEKEKSTEKVKNTKEVKPKEKVSNPKEKKNSDKNEKDELKKDILKAVKSAGNKPTVANRASQIIVSLYDGKHFSKDIKTTLIKRFKAYPNMYEVVLPILSKYDSDIKKISKVIKKEKNVNPKTKVQSRNIKDVNNEITKILSSANYNEAIIKNVISIVEKNINEKNKKNLIYRGIISKYKQTKGLEIYTLIKKHI